MQCSFRQNGPMNPTSYCHAVDDRLRTKDLQQTTLLVLLGLKHSAQMSD